MKKKPGKFGKSRGGGLSKHTILNSAILAVGALAFSASAVADQVSSYAELQAAIADSEASSITIGSDIAPDSNINLGTQGADSLTIDGYSTSAHTINGTYDGTKLGGIIVGDNKTLTIQDVLTWSGFGQAISATGNVVIRAINSNVTFKENGKGISLSGSTEKSLTLSANEGKTLTIEDTIEVTGSGTKTISINSKYDDEVTPTGTVTLKAVTVSDSSTLRNDGTLSGAITNNGTISGEGSLTLTGTSSNADTKSITQKAVTVSDSSTLRNDGTLSGAITNNGTIDGSTGSLTLTGISSNAATKSITQKAVTVSDSSTLTNDGTITCGTLSINSNGTLTNDGTLSGAITNNGNLYLCGGTLGNNIAGKGTTYIVPQEGNDLIINSDIEIEGTLRGESGTLCMESPISTLSDKYSTLTVGNLTGNINFQFDADMSKKEDKEMATNCDKIHIKRTNTDCILNIDSINVCTDGTSGTYKDYLQYITTEASADISNLQIALNGKTDNPQSHPAIITAGTDKTYLFTPGSQKGFLNVVIQENGMTLQEFITAANDSTRTYSIKKSLSQTGDIGTTYRAGDNKKLFVYLNTEAQLIGSNNYDGITVAEGYNLELIGQTGEETVNSFNRALINHGTLHVYDMRFSKNNIDIENTGTLNLHDTIAFSSGISGNGTTNLDKAIVTLDNTASITQKRLNINNSSQLKANASNLHIEDIIDLTNGSLHLTGGENNNLITGEGLLYIENKVTSHTPIIGHILIGGKYDDQNTNTITPFDNPGHLTIGASDIGYSMEILKNGSTLKLNLEKIMSRYKIVKILKNGSTLKLNSGTLYSDIDVANGSGSATVEILGDVAMDANFNNNPDLTIADDGSFHLSVWNDLSVNQATINGTLKFDIVRMNQKPGTEAVKCLYGKLVHTGQLTFGKKSTLAVNMQPGLLTKKEQQTEELQLIKSETVPNDANETLINFANYANNNRYIIKPVEQAAQADKYIIVCKHTLEEIINSEGGNKNNVAAGNAWDTVEENSIAAIINPATWNRAKQTWLRLNDLSQHDAGTYVQSLRNIAPTDSQIAMATTKELANLIDQQVDHRLSSKDDSIDKVAKKTILWSAVLGNYADQDKKTDHAGFIGRTIALAIGADTELSEGVSVGLGYVFSYTEADSYDRDTDISGNTIFLYGKYQPSAWYLRGITQYGSASFDEKFEANGLYNAADYDVNNFGISGYVGYDLNNGVTPEVGLRYTFLTQHGYTDAIGQSVTTDDEELFTGVFGVKYSITFKDSRGFKYTPKARISLTYDLGDNDGKARVNLSGTTYEVNRKKLERCGLEACLGLEANANAWTFSLGYNLGLRKEYISHSAIIGAKFEF